MFIENIPEVDFMKQNTYKGKQRTIFVKRAEKITDRGFAVSAAAAVLILLPLFVFMPAIVGNIADSSAFKSIVSFIFCIPFWALGVWMLFNEYKREQK